MLRRRAREHTASEDCMAFIPPMHFRYGSKDSNWTRQLETNQVSAEGEAESQFNSAPAARILSKNPVLLLKTHSLSLRFTGERRLYSLYEIP